jgi:hypothetical protein
MDNPQTYPSQEQDRADYYSGTIPRGTRSVLAGQPQAQTTAAKPPDGPSIGEKIMSAASAAAAPQAAVGPPVSQGLIGALPGTEPYTQATLRKIAGGAADSARAWLINQADHERQTNQQAHAPLDRHDPRYRMGIGQRILGSLVNFGSGFSRNGLPPVNVGPGALNHRYYQDQQQREDDAAASDLRLQSLQRGLELQDEMHDQFMNPQGPDNRDQNTQGLNVGSLGVTSLPTDTPGNESGQQSANGPLTLYESAVKQAAQETNPAKAADMESGLRMMERIQKGRESGKIKPVPTATDGLTEAELKQFNDQAYGVNQRIAILENAERTPEIETALRKLYQQRDSVANGIKSRRKIYR